MKKLALISLAALCLAAASFAGDSDKAAAPEKPKELKPQSVCPVMGKPIDSSSYTDIQGQRVYHCCPGCSKKLKADPDKYFKEAAAQGVLFENIQKTCPVSGDPIDKASFIDFEGRRIYFCCDDCPPKFLKDPQKFLKAMDQPADKKAQPSGMHGEGHEGHSGH
jgi:YHS domain-containing protein